jgi:four helix bundle protein
MKSGFKDLIVYRKAFGLAMEIYKTSQQFPNEELYSLTSQIRRSSRSVCSNIGEGYRKRLYEAHFISKMSDADMENSETQVWLDFALECKYLSEEIYQDYLCRSQEVGRLIGAMVRNPSKFC